MLLIVAGIHLIPLSGVVGSERIAALYDIELADQNLQILMRHRAVLFGILGVFFAHAAFRPGIQPIAFIAAFVSIASFFYLVFSIGGFNEAIGTVIIVDVVAGIALLVAIVLYLHKSRF